MSTHFLSNIYLEIISTSVYHLKFYCRSQKLQNWQRILVIVPKRWFTSMNNSGKKTGNKQASKVTCISFIFNYFVSRFQIFLSFPTLGGLFKIYSKSCFVCYVQFYNLHQQSVHCTLNTGLHSQYFPFSLFKKYKYLVQILQIVNKHQSLQNLSFFQQCVTVVPNEQKSCLPLEMSQLGSRKFVCYY